MATIPATSSKVAVNTLPRTGAPLRKSPRDRLLEEKIDSSLKQDLIHLGWRDVPGKYFPIPPSNYSKDAIKQAMAHSRNALIARNKRWINSNLDMGRSNLARGIDVLGSEIKPRIELCETQKQHDLFRLFRYYWSSPASDYVGRRMRILVRDDGLEGRPVIGIAAIGSSIIHIPDRDEWIGWDTSTRSENIISMMDAYVIGALPPYNELLGGKLMAYILASNELRRLFKEKYQGRKTIIKGRTGSDLVLLATTSLYGTHSSQYSRLKYGSDLLYQPIGSTSGYGSLHISPGTFELMHKLVKAKGCNVSNKFGMGPNWRMRVIRSACDILKFDSDMILRHSFQRGLYVVSLAENAKNFLRGETGNPTYLDMPLGELAGFWKQRWFEMRKQNQSITDRVRAFTPADFDIAETAIPKDFPESSS